MSATIRIQIASDDGHSCTLLTNTTVTVSKITEDYCRLRKVSDPLGTPQVDPVDCVLAFCLPAVSTAVSDLQYLTSDVKLSTVINKKSHTESDGLSAKFRLFGYHAKKNAAVIDKIQSFAGQLSTLSSSFAKSIVELNAGSQNESNSNLHSIALRVIARVHEFKIETQLIIASGKSSDQKWLDAAQTALQSGDLNGLLSALSGSEAVPLPSPVKSSAKGSYFASFESGAGLVSVPVIAPPTRSTPSDPVPAVAASKVVAPLTAWTAPAVEPVGASAGAAMDVDSDNESTSSSSSGSSYTSTSTRSSRSSVSSASVVLNTTNGAQDSQMTVAEEAEVEPVMQVVPKKATPTPTRLRTPSTSENEIKVVSVPASTYAAPVKTAAPVVQDLTHEASSSDSDSSSGSDSSDSDSDSEADTTRMAPSLDVEALFVEPTPFTQPILSQEEAAQDLQRAKLALYQRLSIDEGPGGLANMTQVSSQSSPETASTELPLAQQDYPPLSQPASLEAHFSQVESGLTQEPIIVKNDAGNESDSGSSSSGSSDSESGSSSDSDSEDEGATARLSQSAGLAALSAVKPPSALQNLLIKPLARKPPSSFLSATQQLQASQELELERQLFPKILTPGEAKQSQADAAHSDSSDSSDSEGSSSSGSSSGSDSDSESGDSSDEEEEKVEEVAEESQGKLLEVGKDAAASDALVKVNGISSALARVKATSPEPEKIVAAAKAAPKSAKKTPAKPKGPKTPASKGDVPAESAAAVTTASAPAAATTTPASGGKGGRGGGRGAGKAGRGADASGAAAGGRGGRGGRGGSKRRDIDPSLLRNMIAGTSTVSTSSMDAGTSSNAVPTTPAATNGAKKRKAASEGKIGTPQFGPTGTQVKAKKPKVAAAPVAAAI